MTSNEINFNNRSDNFAKIYTEDDSFIGFLLNAETIFLPNRGNEEIDMTIICEKLKLTTFKRKIGGHKLIKKDDPILNEKCTICLDKYKIGTYKKRLECKHVFHKKCIDKWLKNEDHCPMCRKLCT